MKSHKGKENIEYYDVVIVGGGPAGAILARYLDKNLRVLVLERRKKEGGFEKCCGGLLAPDAQKMLAKLGMSLPKDVIETPQTFAVNSIDLTNNLNKFYQRHYINVDREKFDRWLWTGVGQNVEIRCDSVFQNYRTLVKEEQDAHLEISYKVSGEKSSVRTKWLIGADGAASRVRRLLYKAHTMPHYVSIQEWYKTEDIYPFFTAIFDEEVTDFYAWTIPKGDYFILGAPLKPNERPHEKFDLLKEKLANKGFDFSQPIKRNGAFLLRPRLKDIRMGEQNVLLVGEAAGFISASSAEGISYAFRSGLALAHAINNKADTTKGVKGQYRKNVLDLKVNMFIKSFKSLIMYNGFLRKCVMKTGLLSMTLKRDI